MSGHSSCTLPSTVRRATLEDAPVLAAIAEQTFRESFEDVNEPADLNLHCTTHFGADIQRAEITDANVIALLGLSEQGIPVGYAQVRLQSPSPWIESAQVTELHRIYVQRDYIGTGIAHPLISAVLDLAQTHGASHTWLGVWENNPRAIAFYRKYGFDVVGEQVFTLGTDPQRDLVMARAMDTPQP